MTEMAHSPTWEAAQRYYSVRGLEWHKWSGNVKGDKFWEEARELVEAVKDKKAPNRLPHVREEIADVTLTLAWIAQCQGTSLEDVLHLHTAGLYNRGPELWPLATAAWDADLAGWRDWGRKHRLRTFSRAAKRLRAEVLRYHDARLTIDSTPTPTAEEHLLALRHEVLQELRTTLLALIWVAYSFHTTVETCIREKTAKDSGRGPGKNHGK